MFLRTPDGHLALRRAPKISSLSYGNHAISAQLCVGVLANALEIAVMQISAMSGAQTRLHQGTHLAYSPGCFAMEVLSTRVEGPLTGAAVKNLIDKLLLTSSD